MPIINKVTGSECLEYINRYLGFSTCAYNSYENIKNNSNLWNNYFKVVGRRRVYGEFTFYNSLYKVAHNTNNRVIGLVRKKYDDGGLKISILGNETLSFNSVPSIFQYLFYQANFHYNQDIITTKYERNNDNLPYVTFPPVYPADQDGCRCGLYNDIPNTNATLDELMDYNPPFTNYGAYTSPPFKAVTLYNGVTPGNISAFPLNTNKNNTLIFGDGREFGVDGWDVKIPISDQKTKNPLYLIGGALWDFIVDMGTRFSQLAPSTFETLEDLEQFVGYPADVEYYDSFNNCTLIFNLLLTENETEALDYLNNGTLPSDAFLYPLDFENLPKYQPQTPSQDDDDDDGGNPDDDSNPSRDVEPTPLVVPALLPTMFNANNMYWLGIGEFSNFLIWFWYDIQQFSIVDPTTWDNLFDNIQGLYSNLASAIISVRYYPIKEEWVGGLGNQEVIKIGQVQKDGLVNTLSKTEKPDYRKIGSYTVDRTFDSFLDLPPYSELTLFLPYYGYVNLDMDMFNGHSVDVYATYDVLSGTITYYVYYDDTFMVNMYTAKMSVDIPITLQTAYDRDRTIQDNVATTLSGFMSAGAGALTGNPVGMVMGISSLNSTVSPQNTAPIKVEGMSVEQGSLYQPSRCAIIIRRPVTTKKGDSFAKNVGNLWCKTARLGDSDLIRGLTICANPRIHFSGVEYYDEQDRPTGKMILPLESEIEEIYDYLSKGVII